MKISLHPLSGIRPAISPTELNTSEGQTANCANVERGDARGFRGMSRTQALTGTAYTSLRKYTGNSVATWIADATNDLDILPSPIVNDTYERAYVTGYAEPRVFANDLFTTVFDPATDYYKLGVPAPTTAPTVEGSGALTRYYTYIYVTAYGERGAPATPAGGSTVAANPDITTIASAPADHRITKIYLYRTATTSTDTALYRYALEATWFDASTAYAVGDYVIYSGALYRCSSTHSAGAWNAGHFTSGDQVADADLGTDTLTTTLYQEPPSGLSGIRMHPAGFMVGFSGDTVYMSEIGLPHTWQYSEPVYETIIGVELDGESIIVLTSGRPYILSGTDPGQMSKTQLNDLAPCSSKRSIVSASNGVYYASTSGPWRVNTASGAVNVGAGFITADDWSNYSPSTMHCDMYDGKYFCWYDNTTDKGCLVFDFINDRMCTLDFNAEDGYVDSDGKYYLIVNDDTSSTGLQCIKEWEGDTINYLYYTWKSKRILLNSDICFAYGRVFIDEAFYNTVLALIEANNETTNAALFADLTTIEGSLCQSSLCTYSLCASNLVRLQQISMSAYVTFKLYVDDVLVASRSVTDSKIFMIPTGYRSRGAVEIQLEGYIPARRVDIATSLAAMRREGGQ